MHRRLKIGFLSSLTLVDKLSSWNITNGYMAHVLEKYCGDITYIEPMHVPELLLGKVFNKAAQMLLKKNFMYYHSYFIARKCAKLISRQLADTDFDLIFAPACASETAFVAIDTPIVIVEDANFALLHNYYAQFSNLLQRSYYEAHTLEGLALNKAALVIHPSPWARRSSLENYHVAQEKVYAVPFGANVENPPPPEVALMRKKSDQCKLFFIGVDWERKGGAIAFETLLKLEELGIQAELTICGCVPPPLFSHERMVVIPFLSRKDEKQRREMEKLFETSDFLFLPTRGECYGMVFCEASSYGLPSITTNTGGVSGAVTNGENGYMLPLSAGGAEYAELIAKVYCDDQGYAELVKSSRAAYENRLNWDAWGMAVTKLIHEMLEREQSRTDAQDFRVVIETISSVCTS